MYWINKFMLFFGISRSRFRGMLVVSLKFINLWCLRCFDVLFENRFLCMSMEFSRNRNIFSGMMIMDFVWKKVKLFSWNRICFYYVFEVYSLVIVFMLLKVELFFERVRSVVILFILMICILFMSFIIIRIKWWEWLMMKDIMMFVIV